MPLDCDILVLHPATPARAALADRVGALTSGEVATADDPDEAFAAVAGRRLVVLADPTIPGAPELPPRLARTGAGVGFVLVGPWERDLPGHVISAIPADAGDAELGIALGRAAEQAAAARTRTEAERELDELASLMPDTGALLVDTDLVCRIARGPLVLRRRDQGLELEGQRIRDLSGGQWEHVRHQWDAALAGVRRKYDFFVEQSGAYFSTDLIPRIDHGRVVMILCVMTDITAQRRAEAAEAEAREQLAREHADLVEAQSLAQVGSWRVRREDGTWSCSDELCRILGRSPGDWPRTVEEFLGHVHPEDRPLLRRAWDRRSSQRGNAELYFRLCHRAGGVAYVHLRAHTERGADGRITGFGGVLQDVTEQQEAEFAVRAAQRRFEAAFDEAPIGMVLMDADGRNVRVNRAICELSGHTEAELLKQRHSALGEGDGEAGDAEALADLLAGRSQRWTAERRITTADGRALWVQLSAARLQASPDEPPMLLCHYLDISHRHRLERRLRHLAEHDPLTGVPNRRAWEAQLPQAIDEAKRTGAPLGVALLDLNDFKSINDTLGHDAGDRVLREVAAAWRSQLRDTDLLARLGGDEFAVLLPDCGEGDLRELAVRLRTALRYTPGCSVGAVTWLPHEGADEVLRRADAALYRDKLAPRG